MNLFKYIVFYPVKYIFVEFLFGGLNLNNLLLITAAYPMDEAIMMTSSNGNIFRVTGPLRGDFTGHLWIPRTKASDAELWYFLWSAPE